MIRLLSMLVLILAIVLFPPAALAFISNNAVPGDATYPIKRALETGILKVASLNPTTKAWFTIKRSERRFHESVTLIADISKDKKAVTSLNEFVTQTQAAADEIKKINNNNQKKKLATELKSSIKTYQQELSKIKQNLESSTSTEPTPTPTPIPIPTLTPVPSSTTIPTSTPRSSPRGIAATPTPTPRNTPQPTGSPVVTPLENCEGEIDPVLGCIIKKINEIETSLGDQTLQGSINNSDVTTAADSPIGATVSPTPTGQPEFTPIATPIPTPTPEASLEPAPTPLVPRRAVTAKLPSSCTIDGLSELLVNQTYQFRVLEPLTCGGESDGSAGTCNWYLKMTNSVSLTRFLSNTITLEFSPTASGEFIIYFQIPSADPNLTITCSKNIIVQ